MPSDEGESCVRDFGKDIDIAISCIQEMSSTKLQIFIFFEKQHAENYPLIDLFKFDYKKSEIG